MKHTLILLILLQYPVHTYKRTSGKQRPHPIPRNTVFIPINILQVSKLLSSQDIRETLCSRPLSEVLAFPDDNSTNFDQLQRALCDSNLEGFAAELSRSISLEKILDEVGIFLNYVFLSNVCRNRHNLRHLVYCTNNYHVVRSL